VTIDLVIAGRTIRLCSREGVIIKPDERFRAFTVSGERQHGIFIDPATVIAADLDPGLPDQYIPIIPSGTEPDLVAEVATGTGVIPAGTEKVFDAQLMEEIPGGIRNSGEPFWEVYRGQECTFARVFLRDPERVAMLVMPDSGDRWRIFAGAVSAGEAPGGSSGDNQVSGGFENHNPPGFYTPDLPAGISDPHAHAGRWHKDHGPVTSPESPGAGTNLITVDPLPYPLDGLLLYFLASREGDIMIHGSGVSCRGRGWLFTGRSGSGKTTLARIFDRAGDRVIHDDRLVLRREGGRWVMHNTPVYRDDEPRSVILDHLWVISHGASNVSVPVTGAEAVALILSNCIQQNWDAKAASRLAAAADDLASAVRVSRLSFLPDMGIRAYLLHRVDEDMALAAGAATLTLDEGKSITVTARGYSMWPAVRPGDRVLIGPCGPCGAAAGQIVALRRDGGFVIHRVTEVITADGGRAMTVTRGDAVMRADEPAGPGMIAGTVLSVTRSGRQLSPPRRRMPHWINYAAALIDSMFRTRTGKITG
jgi:energy-coupling factor transporter ATP-binding protein EcfA2